MDPADFTQKLLARTQARKEQLRKKNEEFNACRNKRNAPPIPSPARPRRPLSEDNNNGGIPDESPRQRIVSDGSIPHTPQKVAIAPRVATTPKSSPIPKVPYSNKAPTTPNAVSKVRGDAEADASSPSIQARKERLILMQQKDKESCITPKKHWKKALDMNSNENQSPSLAARSAMFETNQERGSAPSVTPGRLSSKRNIFEKNPQPVASTDPKPLKSAEPPPKPPRIAETEKPMHREKSSSKRKAPVPPSTEATDLAPKPRSDVKDGEGIGYGYSAVSAKNTEEVPPKKERRLEKTTAQEKTVRTTVEVVMEAVPKPRKRTQQAASSDEEERSKCKRDLEDEIRHLEEERAKRRKARMESRDEDEVIVAKAQAVEPSSDKQSARSNHGHPQKVEAVAVHVSEVSSPKRVPPRPSTRVEVVMDVVDNKDTHKKKEKPLQNNAVKSTETKPEPVLKQEKPVFKQDKPALKQEKPVLNYDKPALKQDKPVLNHDKPALKQDKPVLNHDKPALKQDKPVLEQDKPVLKQDDKITKSSNTTEREHVHKAKIPSTSRLLSTENLHRYGSLGDMNAGMDDELNETVNLNDVNIHEMTFTFDFSDFDKIEEDRETKFQKSFNETQKELENEKMKDTNASQPCSEIESVKRIASQPKPTSMVEEKDNGVFKSGYSMDTDDKYATKVYKKSKPPIPERPKPTKERIKELLDQAASHQNIILQTSQALNMCEVNNDIFKGSQEEVEAERVLLLASERKQACLNEQQRLKNGRKESRRGHHVDRKACTSTVSLSGIRLSVKQEFMDVLRLGIRHDLGVFHFVCHVQNGPLEITSTKTLSIHDCTGENNTLTFPDKFVMKNLNPDFKIVVRVFGLHVQKYNPYAATTPQKHKFFQSPKAAKNKRRLPDGTSPGGAECMPVFRNSNFKLVGSALITLPLVNTKKWLLDGLVEGCPLQNTIHLKIHCMPLYSSCVKGFLTILEDVGGFSAWQRRWCVLEGGMLSYWRYPGDEADKAPLGTTDMGQCVSEHITTVPRDLCARPNTIEVTLKKDKNAEESKFLLACDTKEDRVTWIHCLNDALTDMKAWDSNNKRALYPEISHVVDDNVQTCSRATNEK